MSEKRLSNNSLDLLKNIGKRVQQQQEKERKGEKEEVRDQDSRPQKSRGLEIRDQNDWVQSQKKSIESFEVEKNFTKIDNDVFDRLLPSLSLRDQVLYIRLYFESLRWQKNTFQISNSDLQKKCKLSHQSVREGLNFLEEEGLIEKLKESTNKKPPVYRIITPQECLSIESKTRYIWGQNSRGRDDRAQDFRPLDSRGQNTRGQNNSAIELLSESRIFQIPDPIVYEICENVDYNDLKQWVDYIEDNAETIKNPSGFLRSAIEQKWNIPFNWSQNQDEEKRMKKKAKEEEEKIKKEKEAWEKWLESAPDDILNQSEEYAEKKMKECLIKDTEIRKKAFNGYRRDFLRREYEKTRS